MTPGAGSGWAPYCGAAPVPAELLSRWNFDPMLLLVMAAFVIGRQFHAGQARQRETTCAYASVALALFLFVSPFCALTSALFSARVVHHVLLAAVLASLLAFSLPRDRLLTTGSLAGWTGMQAVIFWAWHVPSLYSAALSNDAIYWLMQITLTGASFAFWSSVRRASPPSAVGALLFTMVQMGLLGALITFAGTPLYAPHFASTVPWGLSPLDDQQLAGLIMWAPSAAIYLSAALIIASRWLRSEARAAVDA